MNVRRRTNRATSMLAVAALVTSGLMAVSVASGVGVVSAAAAGPVPTAVSLAADKTAFAVGEKVALTATPNQSIKGSGYMVVVSDVTTGAVVGQCETTWDRSATWSVADGTCTVTTSFTTGGPRTYRAYVAASTALTDLRATSNDVTLERIGWSVSLVADKDAFAVGEKVTLTATPNQNIRGSGYMVVVSDVTTGVVVGQCETTWDRSATWSVADGTCTVTTSFTTGGPRTYRAYVAAGTSLTDLQATSGDVDVSRAAWTVTLSADRTVFSPGEKVTLTATPNQSIRGSGYMVVVSDVTTGVVVGRCETTWDRSATWSVADGTCTVTTSFTTGGPRTYQAYVAASTSLTDVQATSGDVEVSRAAWTVTLSADRTAIGAGEKVTLTAQVNQDLRKASVFRVVVVDTTTSTTVGYCGPSSSWDSSGATWSAQDLTCSMSASFTPDGTHTYRAYVAASTSLTDVQATSNDVQVTRDTSVPQVPWSVTLSVDRTVIAAGEQVTLVAGVNQDIMASAYQVVVMDVTTGRVVAYCQPRYSSTGTWSAQDKTCTVTTWFETGGPHTYQAFVAADTSLADLQATSNEVTVSRAAWTVTLTADQSVFAVGEQAVLSATVNQDIMVSAYQVVVVDVTTGRVVGYCQPRYSSTGTWSAQDKTCTVTTWFETGGPHTYQAFVAADTSLTDVQATSNEVEASRAAWTVTLTADRTVYAVGEEVTFTATVNQDVGDRLSAYNVVIQDTTTGSVLGNCGDGYYTSGGARWSSLELTCTDTDWFGTGGPRTYQAFVAAYSPGAGMSDVQASSNQVSTSRLPWTLELEASTWRDGADTWVTLVASTNQDASHRQSAYSVYLVNATTGGVMAYCPSMYSGGWSDTALTCTYTTMIDPATTYVFRAYIAASSGLDDVQAASNAVVMAPGGGPTSPSETAGGSNPSEACSQSCHGDPVNTATGEFFESVVDLEVPGLGPGLVWSRTYGSQVIGDDKGLGFGWSSPYTMRLVGIGSAGLASPWVDVVQENGSRVRFASDGLGGYAAPSRVLATLTRAEDGSFRFVRGARQVFLFDAAGRLVRVEDLNGNGVGLSYDAAGYLVRVGDDAGRSLTVTWSDGRIAQVADPVGRVVSYAYSPAGDLIDVTQVDGTHLGYEYAAHRLTSMTSATGGVTTNVYDSSGRVTRQTDPLGRATTFAYAAGGVVTVTDPAGHVTREAYVDGRLAVQTVGYGTPQAATTGFVYGPTNQVVQVTDPLGRVSTATYDGAGHRTSMTDPLDRTTTWTYDGLGDMTSATDPTGATWTYTFDERGNATGVTSPTGAQTTVVVNADGTAASMTDPLGRVTSYGYDPRGYRTQVTDPTGATTRAAWDQVGRMTSTTDARGKTTTMGYDPAGRLTSVTEPTGAVTTMGYDAAGRPTTVTDPLSRTITAAYDAAGQLVSVADPAGGTTTVTYDGAGQVASVTDPTGAVTTYGYDSVGRQVSVTDPLDRATTVTYDAASQVTAVTSPSGAVWAYAYDAAGQATTVTDPLEAVWTTSYDAAGRPVTVRDPLGRTVTTGYDAAGRVTSVTRADASVVVWTLDAAGQTTAYADPSGTTTYVYDGAGRPVSVTDPAGRTTGYAWDGAGYLTSTTLPGGGTAAYGYDAAGRRTSTVYSDATPDVTWTYDAAGQVQQVSDGTSYTYTPTGLVASVTGPTGTVSYGWDAAGRLTDLTYPGGQQVGYAWDGAGQLVQVTDWTGGQYDYAWTDDGQVASVAFPNEVTTAWDHDDAGQTTAITTENSDETALLALGYAFDDAGQLVSSTSVRSPTGRSPPDPASTSSQVRFDLLGRLDQVTGNGAGTFGWDSAGLLTGTADGRTLQYDDAGQLASLVDPGAGTTTTFAYDADGNRTSQTTGTATTAMTWDVAGHLTGHTTATTSTAYTYDATGLRTSAATTTGGTTTTEQYVWDSLAAVPRLLADAEHLYLYGLDDVPLAQVAQADGTVSYLHTDLVGSVRTTTEADGDVVCDADYDPYGQPRQVTDDPCEQTTRFGYAGQYTDPTGLQYLRHRYYDPPSAQFLSVDPHLDTTGDPYGYAGGNPLQNTDPLGLDWLNTLGNAAAGFGDAVTFGGTRWIRQQMGTDSVVDTCSTAYAWGGYAGIAASMALPVPGFAVVASAARVFQGARAIHSVAAVVTRIQATVSRTGPVVRQWLRVLVRFGDDTGAIGAGAGRIRGAKDVTQLPSSVTALATKHVTNSGDTVLGHYPGYIDKAKSRGASYFDVGEEWGRMVARGDDPWVLNRAFLDDRVAAGDRMLLSHSRQNIRPGSSLNREVLYLEGKGYVWVNQWALKPKG